MKQFFVLYLLPLLISITSTLFLAFNTKLNHLLFDANTPQSSINADFKFIENFYNQPIYENQFLNNNGKTETIFLLGSSELTSSTAAIPYNFISDHFGVQVKAVGHAGNQCLSIYSQLLANENKLSNAPIVIILSPSWFESKTTKGTPSDIYLEFNSVRFLNRIIKEKNQSEYHAYLYQRIAQLYNEFNAPYLELRLMNFTHQSSKSIINKVLFAPVLFSDNLLLSMREKISFNPIVESSSCKRIPITPENVSLQWDSLFTHSKATVLMNANNNNMGIANSYYDEYKNKKGQMKPVPEIFNQELADMRKLLQLLKAKNANASFIISPLNPFYFKNLNTLTPTINSIENEIKINGFNYYNMFETDTSKYDKALLFDVMHLSDYGWYKIDQFIVNNYHLNL